MGKLIISEERIDAEGPIALVRLRGTIETTNAAGLEEMLEQVISDQCYRIVVDLGAVTYVSSAGWGIFISEIKRIRRNDGDMKLAAMVPEVREVFDLLEFNSILKPFDDTASAISDFEEVVSDAAGKDV